MLFIIQLLSVLLILVAFAQTPTNEIGGLSTQKGTHTTEYDKISRRVMYFVFSLVILVLILWQFLI